ncbi:MAG: hypothetical protein P8107_14720 [Spirochaetia bacterium]
MRDDDRVKPDAFIPHPRTLDVSVTRTKDLSESKLKKIGKTIADRRPAPLYGNARIKTIEVRTNDLDATRSLIY